MAETRPSCRLRVLFAARSPRAVVFRRGPSKSTRLIAWDRATDTFEPGQWVTRTSVYPERSALSPDGEWLLAFLGTFRKPFDTFTVLSRPPYFTALALWPKGDTWGGGGAFIGPREIVLFHPTTDLAPGFAVPGGFTVLPMEPATRARLEGTAAYTGGWDSGGDRDSPRWMKPLSEGIALVATTRRAARYRTEIDYHLKAGGRAVPLPGAQWADVDTNGDVLFSIAGALYRLRAGALAGAVARGDPLDRARRLADFAEMRFEPVKAPYATGGEGAYAPRLDRRTKEDRRRIRERKALRERLRDA